MMPVEPGCLAEGSLKGIVLTRHGFAKPTLLSHKMPHCCKGLILVMTGRYDGSRGVSSHRIRSSGMLTKICLKGDALRCACVCGLVVDTPRRACLVFGREPSRTAHGCKGLILPVRSGRLPRENGAAFLNTYRKIKLSCFAVRLRVRGG